MRLDVAVPYVGAPGVVVVYALVDPWSAEVRYVGSTLQPRSRLLAHASPSPWPRGSPRRHAWAAELRALGIGPALVMLEMCAHSARQAAEERWIGHYASPALLNDSRHGTACPRGEPEPSGHTGPLAYDPRGTCRVRTFATLDHMAGWARGRMGSTWNGAQILTAC